MIEDLIDKNYAYINNNHVYFEVKKFKDYGKLSNKNLEELGCWFSGRNIRK